VSDDGGLERRSTSLFVRVSLRALITSIAPVERPSVAEGRTVVSSVDRPQLGSRDG
jgi:hypothetical protein